MLFLKNGIQPTHKHQVCDKLLFVVPTHAQNSFRDSKAKEVDMLFYE